MGVPAYVQAIDKETNTITIGFRDDLNATELFVRDIHFSKYQSFESVTDLKVKIRYNTQPAPCSVEKQVDGRYKVLFENPVWAVTPGQSAVFYEGEDLVAGGIIELK